MDVFLQPLIEELKQLWEGVNTRDAVTNDIFLMHAAVLWTINDFPAYALMSGWSTKGYKACPTCNEETPSKGIRNKIAYIGHIRFLPLNDPMRRSKQFDGKVESRSPIKELTAEDILAQLEHVHVSLPEKHKQYGGIKRKRSLIELNWSKKSIFFQLEYWQHLPLRHNLDVMHIEKNVCDNVLGTLLNIKGKSKDTEKARLDLQDMGIRKELHLYKDRNKWKKPPATYTLSAEERHLFCRFIKSVKFSDGFAANLSKNVNETIGKISGLKSHDCHVLLQRLLPAGIRPYLKKEVRETITELCNFFRQICAKTLNVSDLKLLETNVVLILCKLERIFPPAFFDIMVHLILHLPKEAMMGGPVYFRWMYCIERAMGIYKQYVSNRARPEGSIAEAYIVNEALNFCSMYFRDIETRYNRPERNDDRVNICSSRVISIFKHVGRPLGKKEVKVLEPSLRSKAEWEHRSYLLARGVRNVEQIQEVEFPIWFRDKVNEMRSAGSHEATDELYALANRSNFSVYSYSGAIINGVKFLVEQRDVRRTTQNSGILVSGVAGQNFYGVLQEVIELCYLKDCTVLLFKCKWFDTDPRKRIIQEDNIFTSIYTGAEWYMNDPFILASQAKSVYYLNDIKNGPIWKLVQVYARRNLWDYPNIEGENDVDTTGIDPHVVQETNSQSLQLVVDLSELENVSFHRDDIEPSEVTNVDQLLHNKNDFVVDVDDFEDDILDEYDEEEDSDAEIDDDESIENETNGTTSEEVMMSSFNASGSGVHEDELEGDGRGRQTTWRQESCSIVLEKALKKQKVDKLEVKFEEYTGGSVGKSGKWFNNFIAQTVRDTISPLVTSWEDVALVDKQLIFDRLDNKFIYPKTSVVKAEVERLAMRTIRDRRCKMRRHWKQLDGLQNKDAPKRKPYKGVSQENWVFLCDYFGKKEQMEISEKNTNNRFSRLLEGAHGSKTLVQHYHDDADMIELRSTQLEGEVSASTVDNVHQPKDLNIMTQVLGSRSQYVKGLGPLPKLSVVGGARATNVNSKHCDDSGKIMSMQQMIDEKQHTISEQQKTISEHEQKFDAILQQLQQVIPGFSFQPPASSST
ncbi:uncharacterized protein [Henckelia pumila]|uniref:uncharacterized protein n=1 Tax=Henckelia pumila TaxID=405737 RepID=UPI003C6E22AF